MKSFVTAKQLIGWCTGAARRGVAWRGIAPQLLLKYGRVTLTSSDAVPHCVCSHMCVAFICTPSVRVGLGQAIGVSSNQIKILAIREATNIPTAGAGSRRRLGEAAIAEQQVVGRLPPSVSCACFVCMFCFSLFEIFRKATSTDVKSCYHVFPFGTLLQ